MRKPKRLSFDQMLEFVRTSGKMPPAEQRPKVSVRVGSAEGYVGQHDLRVNKRPRAL